MYALAVFCSLSCFSFALPAGKLRTGSHPVMADYNGVWWSPLPLGKCILFLLTGVLVRNALLCHMRLDV